MTTNQTKRSRDPTIVRLLQLAVRAQELDGAKLARVCSKLAELAAHVASVARRKQEKRTQSTE